MLAARSLLGTSGCHHAAQAPATTLARSVSSCCVQLTLPLSQCAHGFNVFITCLTRCLIASPLNGAVTVETRNKRPPENEMIKQVTLAKQTQCSHSPGCGRGSCPGPGGGHRAVWQWEQSTIPPTVSWGAAPRDGAPHPGASTRVTARLARGRRRRTRTRRIHVTGKK